MVRVMNRKFNYIYKITRFDGKYYIGMHSTDDINDGYFGSGKRLWHSINYHGKDKHRMEILEFFPDRTSLNDRERELVTEATLKDPLCLNLCTGGGYLFRKQEHEKSGENRKKAIRAFYASEKSKVAKEKIRKTHLGRIISEETRVKMKKSAKERMERMQADGSWDAVVEKNRIAHLGKKHTPEVIEKRRLAIAKARVERGGKFKPFSEQAKKNIANAQIGNEKRADTWILTDVETAETMEIKNFSKWYRTVKEQYTLTRDMTMVLERVTRKALFSIEKKPREKKQMGRNI